jgi:PKD repeat protein
VVAKEPQPPRADFTVTPNSGPAPLSTSFVDQSTGSITAWSWDFGDGTSSSLRYPKHVYRDVGTYTVTLTVSGKMGTSARKSAGGGPPLERTLRDEKRVPDLIRAVEPPPVAGFSAEPVRGLPPLVVAFRDQSTPNVTSWTWDFGDGTGGSGREPRHTYAEVGRYDVTLTVRGPSGTNALTRSDLVEVLQPLHAAFDFVQPAGVAPVTVQFTDRSLGGATSWLWSFGDGLTSTLRNPSHRFDQGGTFPVQLTVTGAGQTDSTTAPVSIPEPPPDARFSASITAGNVPLRVQFSDQSTGNVTAWQWDFGDGHGSFERNPFHAYLRAGVYTVRFRVWSAGGVDTMVRRDFIRVANPLGRVLRFGVPGGLLPTSGPLPSAPTLELPD